MTEERGAKSHEDSGDETEYLLRSASMRTRLLAALQREEGIEVDEVVDRLGLEER